MRSIAALALLLGQVPNMDLRCSMNTTPSCLRFRQIIWAVVSILACSFQARGVLTSEELVEMGIEKLLDVEISVASKKLESLAEAPGAVSVVTREEFEVYGDRNLHQLLQRQPSIYTRGSYMYPNNIASFRGDMPTHLDLHTLVLLNGRPIRESNFGGVNFPVYMAFLLKALDSVEIIRGPGSVLYGTNAFTGVINLKSRSIPERTEASVSAMGGSYGAYDITCSVGGRQGDLGYTTDIRVGGQDGYRYALTDERGVFGSHQDNNHSLSGTMHLEYGRFILDAFAVDLETFHLGPLPWWSLAHHEYAVKKLFANAGYRLPLDGRTTLELNLTYNLHENRFGNVTQWVGVNSSDLIGEVTILSNPIDRLDIAIGYLQEYRTSYPPKEGYYQSIPTYRYHPQAAYAQADYRIIDPLKVIAGAQWNKSCQGYEDIVNRCGLIFNPFKKWGLKLLRGEAFRAPFAIETDLYDVPILVGNKDLRPETIVTYDVQIFYDDHKTYAAVTYFHNSIEDLVIRNTAVSPASFKNAGRQQFDGIELEARYRIRSGWQLLGSAMVQNNKQTANLNYSTAPDYMAKLGTDYTWDWATVGIWYSHFGKPPRLPTEVVVNPEPEALDLITLNVCLDVSAWLTLPKRRAILTLRVENLLDEDIWVPEFNRGGHPNSLPDGPGWTFFAGLTYDF